MKLNCLIIDDEPLARKGISEYVKEIEFLQSAGECASAAEAANIIAAKQIDLLLLDIQMPRLSGIDFLKTLTRPPMAIFTTAYSEYALEGYSLDVIDYLVKPIPFDRFLKAVQKAYDFHHLRSRDQQSSSSEYFFVKSNGKYEKVAFADILYVESMQNYVLIHLPGQKLIVYMTLAGLEAQLPQGKFIKVHKSFIVAIGQVNSIENNEIIIRQARIPISRTLKDEVLRKILGDNLLSR
ncbi:MAG TPA: LytTR family DNA-binding domain-containing protein [Cyclobacteriaceae bacterium]|nr:LytTR family DNA-binding domain-containing protein [Cyclobacteriaceae bacterium]